MSTDLLHAISLGWELPVIKCYVVVLPGDWNQPPVEYQIMSLNEKEAIKYAKKKIRAELSNRLKSLKVTMVSNES